MNLDLEGGGTLTLLELEGDRAVVQSTRPFPPGSSPMATSTASSAPWLLKVRSCRAEGEAFRIEGRWVNLTRAQKELAKAGLSGTDNTATR